MFLPIDSTSFPSSVCIEETESSMSSECSQLPPPAIIPGKVCVMPGMLVV